MAKDLVFNDKMEFDSADVLSNINIRKYDGIWDNDTDLRDVICRYTKEYANLKNLSYADLMELVNKLNIKDSKGSFVDFECENSQLKDVMVEDFLNELKLEFPDNFK